MSLTKSSLLVVALLGAVQSSPRCARDYGQFRNADPAIRDWIQGLKNKAGQSCCETADGHPAEYEWDIVANQYKVRIEGEWYAVPAEAVIDEPNKLGYATVWYWGPGNSMERKSITSGVSCLVRGGEA
jgi:hypothetical protein